jgi:hypothetical protein
MMHTCARLVSINAPGVFRPDAPESFLDKGQESSLPPTTTIHEEPGDEICVITSIKALVEIGLVK